MAPASTVADVLARGDLAYDQGRFDAARDAYAEALARSESPAGDRYRILYRLGRAQNRLHAGAQAQASFRQAIAAAADLPAGTRASVTSQIELALAESLRTSGELPQARAAYLQALPDFEAKQDFSSQVVVHAGLGAAWQTEAHFPEALREYQAALALLVQIPAESSTTLAAPLLLDAASLRVFLGQYDEARRLLDDAAQRCAARAPALCTAYVEHARSLLADAMHDDQASADAAWRAALAFGAEHPIEQAHSLNNHAMALVRLHRAAEAIPVLQKVIAQETASGDEPRDIAAATDTLGSAWAGMGRPELARTNFVAALQIWQRLDNREGQRITLANLGDLAVSQHQTASAVLFYKLAVNNSQSLRADAQVLDTATRNSLTRRVEPAYRSLAGLLVDQGRLAEANQVTRMLKQQERFEYLRGGGAADEAATAAMAGPEHAQAAKYAELANNQFALMQEFASLDAKDSSDRSAADQKRLAELRLRMAAADDELARFVTALEQALATEKRLEPPNESSQYLANLQSSLSDLGHHAVLLRYVVLDRDADALRIILVGPELGATKGYRVDVSALELNNTVEAFRQAIGKRDPGVVAIARRLHDWLLPEQLRADLAAAGAGMLMVSLDGTLRYLPFGALHDGHGWLAEKYPVAVFDDAAAMRLLMLPKSTWTVQGFGMTQGADGLPALSGVRAELDGIVGDGRMPGQARFDADFTERNLKDAVNHQPPVLHIASHFVFRLGTDDSYLLLGQGRLTLSDLKSWQFKDIDLITLSACDTAVSGGIDANGREIESFASMAQQKGAAAVLATLWAVYDPSTANFMSAFYAARRLSGGATPLTKAEAIQAAQVAMIRGRTAPPAGAASASRGEVEGGPANAAPDYSHPYYWAPFVLVGNWL